MPKYVVYEIWTRSTVIEAEDEQDAYDVGEPDDIEALAGWGLGISNWHVQPIDEDEDGNSN